MTRGATLSRQQFTQTDPIPYGGGAVFESALVYAESVFVSAYFNGRNNPAVYTRPQQTPSCGPCAGVGVGVQKEYWPVHNGTGRKPLACAKSS